MRKLIILIFLAIPFTLFPQTKGYLPLEIGNTWYFNSNALLDSYMRVISDTTINGKVYKSIYNRAMADYRDTMFLRQDSNKVYRLHIYTGTELQLYDFASAAGDTFFQAGNFSSVCIENKLVQYAGGTRRQWLFYYGSSCIDCTNDDILVDSIGWRQCGGQNYISTLTRALIRGKEIVTGVRHIQEIEPHTFDVALYPNPFNAEAILEYSIPRAGTVQISLVNALGQSVRTHSVELASGGRFTFNISANGLSSGLYFCRVVSGDLVAVKKALLLK